MFKLAKKVYNKKFLCYNAYMLGIDIEQVNRFLNWENEKLARIFTDNEIEYANKQKNSAQHLCGIYCVKEAFIKAADNKKIAFKNIEVLHTKSGKPYVNLNDEILNFLNKINKKHIEISISHTAEYAVAVVQFN